MEIVLNYRVKAGKYDDNDDVFEWTVAEAGEDLKDAYERAIMTDTDFDDVPELESLCDTAYGDIEKHVLKRLADSGDDFFVLECLGETKMDPDELNELVHAKDPRAIRFFGLEGLPDGELQKWDSADMDSLPLVKDFKEGFAPRNPFECGYTLTVWIPESDRAPDDGETEKYLRKALSDDDVALAEEVVLAQSDNYSGDLIEKAFEIAEEVGCQEFILKNKRRDLRCRPPIELLHPYRSESVSDSPSPPSSLLNSRRSPGWQSRTSHIASRVESLIALTLPVFSLDRFTLVMPTLFESSTRVIFLSSITWSRRITIGISHTRSCTSA